MTYRYYAGIYNEDSPPTSLWVEFTKFLVSGNTVLNQRVESENPGQAGAIVFDNIDLTFFYSATYNPGGTANLVYDFFHNAIYSSDLDLYPRVMIKITACTDPVISGGVVVSETETQIFLGMIDFSSITYPVIRDATEYITTINFTVVEKLSALAILQAVTAQRTRIDINARFAFSVNYVTDRYLVFTDAGSGWVNLYWMELGLGGIGYVIYNSPNLPVINKGETIILDTDDYNHDEYFVVDSRFNVTTQIKVVQLMTDKYPNTVFGGIGVGMGVGIIPFNLGTSVDSEFVKIYSPAYYGSADNYICNMTGGTGEIESFKTIKIIEKILQSRWKLDDLTLRLKTPAGTAIDDITTKIELPLYYYGMLYDEYPLNQEALDAIYELVRGIKNCYLYTDTDGSFVLENKNYVDYNSTDVYLLPAESLKQMTKKHMWDKLVDSVTVYVKSWIRNAADTDYIDGAATVSIKSNLKPRNEKKIDIIAHSSDFTTTFGTYTYDIAVNATNGMLSLWDGATEIYPKGAVGSEYYDDDVRNGLILNYYAERVAAEYLAFYGVRRFAYDVPIARLESSMLSWKMLNIFKFNAGATDGYFFAISMAKDLSNNTMSMELVGRTGATGDTWKDNIVAVKSNDEYVSGSGEAGGDSSSLVAGGGVSGDSLLWDGRGTELNSALGRESLELLEWLGGDKTDDYVKDLYVRDKLYIGNGVTGTVYDEKVSLERYEGTGGNTGVNFLKLISQKGSVVGSLIIGVVDNNQLAIDFYQGATGVVDFINFYDPIMVNEEILTTKIATDKSLELEIMKMNFQSVSWAQFAIFDGFDNETKRNVSDPSTYLAVVDNGKLSNGEDETINRYFGFVSKTYSNINRLYSGNGSGSLNTFYDSSQSWFTNECTNMVLVDSAAASFTVVSNTNDTLTVVGTPTSGAYYLKTTLPSSTIVFCSFADSTNGGFGYVKLEISFNGGINYQTFLDTETSVNVLEGTVAIANPGVDYIARLTLKNNGSGEGAIIYKFLCCTDPSCWRF